MRSWVLLLALCLSGCWEPPCETEGRAIVQSAVDGNARATPDYLAAFRARCPDFTFPDE